MRDPNRWRRSAILVPVRLATILLAVSPPALALDVGYYDMSLGSGSATQVAPITAAGHTAVRMFNLTAAELATVDVLFVQNPSNGSYGAEYLSRLSDVENAVAGGLILILHDRYVEGAESILPGDVGTDPDPGDGVDCSIVRSFTDANSIDIRDATTKVTAGAGGTLTNASLDGGNFSSHGYACDASLPAGAKLILTRTDPAWVVTFSYVFGDGGVIYSSIPLDNFLAGGGSDPPRSAFNTIYAPNVIDYATLLALHIPDLAVTVDDGRSSAVPGETVTYTVLVGNLGPGDAPGATVEIDFAGALTGVTWTCTAGGTSSCPASGSGDVDHLVELHSGDTLLYVATGTVNPAAVNPMTTTATVINPVGPDPSPANNSDSDTDTLTPIADLSVAKAGPAAATSGGPLVYTLTVANAGPSDATGVSLSDPTPNGLVLASAGAPCAGGFPCALGTVAAGGSVNVQVTYEVPSPYLGDDPVVNRAAVAAGPPDPYPGDNTVRSSTAVDRTASADLGLTVTAPASAAAGSTVTYRLRVDNAGPDDAQGVTLAHTPPAGLALLGATAPCQGGFPCSLGTVNAGAGATVEVTFGIPGGFGGSLLYSASVGSSTADPDAADNSGSVQPALGADTHDLVLTKTGPVAADPGGDVTYLLTVTNLGPADAASVLLSDPDPAGLVFVSATAPCGGGFDCDLGTVAAGESVTVAATWNVPAGYSGADPVVNTAGVSAAGVESFPGDEQATARTGLAGDAVNLSLEKAGPAEAAAGTRLGYTLTVHNEGPGTATGVVLSDTFPGGVTFAGATAPCAGGFPCSLGALAAGQSVVVGVDFDVDADHVFPDPLTNSAAVTTTSVDFDPGDDSSQVTTDVVRIADLAITKDDGVTETAPGLTVTYTIAVANHGPGDVTGASVADSFPAQVAAATWTCAAGAGASCTASGSGDIADSVDLPAGSAVTYTVAATLAADAAGTLLNTATVAPPAGATDPVADNDSASDSDIIVPPADLVVTKTGPAEAVPGTPLVYTLEVRNSGAGAAVATVLDDPTPAGLVFTTATAPCQAGFPCDLGTLAPGAAVPVTVTFAVPADYAGPAPVVNTATASSDSPESDPADNSDSESTPVVRRANLGTVKTDGRSTLVPGTGVTYTITLTNSGPSDAPGATVTDTPPPQLLSPSWTCSAQGGAACGGAAGTGAIAETVHLPAGGSLTYLLSATVDPAATTAVVNQVTVAPPAGVTDPVSGNNTASDSSGLTPTADLAVSKENGLAAVVPGEAVSYQVTVSNLGPSHVTGASVTDTPPAALLSPTWTCSAQGGAACGAAAGSGAIAETVDLPAGTAVTYTLTGTVDAAATGTLANTAQAAVPAAVVDPVAANNSATDSDPLERVARLTLSKQGPGAAFRGSSLTWVLSVKNAGPSGAEVTLTDPTPPGLTLTAAEAPCAGGFPCTFDLAAGGVSTFSVTYAVPAGYAGPDPIVNRAAVASDAADPEPEDNLVASAVPLERPATADLALTKAAPAVSAVGSTVTYRLTVTNDGPDDAPGLVLSESIPPGLTFVSATPPCQSGFSCSLGTLNAGASASVEVTLAIPSGYSGSPLITNTASVSSIATDPDPADNSAQGLTDLIADPIDLVVTKTGPAGVDAGQDVTYTLRVENRGPATATNVDLFDPTPPGLAFVAATAPCTAGFPCFLDAVAPGEVVTVAATFHVPAGYAGADPVVNTASVRANQLDAVEANDSAAQATGVAAEAADLVLTKEGPADAAAGALLHYTLVARNRGPGRASAVTLADPAPAGTTFVAATAPCAGGFPCALGDLSPGTALVVQATFRSLSSRAPGSSVVNTATLSSPSPDPVPGDRSATVTSDLFVEADLEIVKSNGLGAVVPGTAVSYQITVTNRGPSDAAGVRVTDVFPPPLTGVSWTCAPATAGASCAPAAAGSGNLDATVSLKAGDAVTYTATGTVAPGATGILTNTANVIPPAGVPDPVSGNNQATDSDPLTPQTDLAVTKTDGEDTAVPGEPVTYTVTVTNNGPSHAVAVSVSDAPPPELLSPTWTCSPQGGAACGATSGTGAIAETADLPAGSSVVYTLVATLAPGATGDLLNQASVAAGPGAVDPAPGNNQASDLDAVSPLADLAVSKSDGSATAVAGEAVTWEITVVNLGPSDAPGVTVTDAPPAAALSPTWTCSPQGGAACGAAAGAGAIAETADLPAGGRVTYSLTATIDPAATGSLANTAGASVPAGVTDPVAANDSATDLDTLVRRADLALRKLGPAVATRGGSLAFTLTVENHGPSDGVAEISDPTPPGLSLDSVGAPCAGGFPCTVPLAAGASESFTVTYTVPALYDGPDPIVNHAAVRGDRADPDPSNNAVASAIPVERPAQADLAVTKEGPAFFTVDATVTYRSTVINLGPDDAPDVTLDDPTPAGLVFLSATGPCAGGFPCDLGTLNAGAALTVEATYRVPAAYSGPNALTNTASVAGAAADPEPANDSDTSVANRTANPVDLVVVKDGPETVEPGDDLAYTLTVTNRGPGTATGVTLTDPAPPGLAFVSASAPCAAGFPCNLGTLAAGAAVTVDATFHLAAPYAGADPIVNIASADADQPEAWPGDNAASRAIGIAGEAVDLVLAKTGPAEAVAGTLGHYTLVARNLGPGRAEAVTLDDPTPAGTAFVAATAPCAAGFPCALGDLDAGSAVVVQATFQVLPGLTAADQVVNTAQVTSSSPDPAAGNNSAAVTTGVTVVADLAVTKTDGLTEAVPGSPITYTVTVTNLGPSRASGVRVTDAFPPALTGASWTCTASAGSSCGAAAGNGNIDHLVLVRVGGTVTYTATATVASGAAGSLVNTAVASPPAGGSDPDLANNSATDTDTLAPRADLAITKTDGSTVAPAGGSTTYTITVTNLGPSDVAGATVTDVFPPAVTAVAWTCSGSGGGSCGVLQGSGDLDQTVTLPAGGSVTYLATAGLDPAATGNLVNTATVAPPASVPDPSPGNNSATDTDTLVPPADLAVSLAGAPDRLLEGGAVTYSLAVSNAGPGAASGVAATLTLPPALVFVAADPPICSLGAGEVRCDIGALPAGGTAAVDIEVTAPAAGTFRVTATVAGGEADPDLTDNEDQVDTTVRTPEIFLDGFESGDLSAWSAAELGP